MTYLTTRGILLLKPLLELDIQKWYSPIQGRDFCCFLLKIIPLCYPYISTTDAEKVTTSVLDVVECIFCLIIRIYSEPTLESFDSTTHIEIIQTLSTMFANETSLAINNDELSPILLWLYQMKIRALFSIIRQTFRLFTSAFISQLKTFPISTIINDLNKRSTPSISTPSYSLVRLTFDTLQGFLILIENILTYVFDEKLKKMNKKETKCSYIREILPLISELLTSDYFTLFQTVQSQCETRSKQIIEYLHEILKRLKSCRIYLYNKQRCMNSDTKFKTHKHCKYIHLHQSQFEITIPHTTNDGISTTRRICVISTLYDKLLRLANKQIEQQTSITFAQDCLNVLSSCGSCSCYPLSHYRSLLINVNHLTDHFNIQRQTISLLRNAFLLIRSCEVISPTSQSNKQPPDTTYMNSAFWTYISTHLLQQESLTQFSLEFSRSLLDLIQCCSSAEKRTILFVCILPALEYYRLMYSSTSTNENTHQIVQNILLTLPTLIDCVSDLPDSFYSLLSSSNFNSNVSTPMSCSPSSINSTPPTINFSNLPSSTIRKQSTISNNLSLLDTLIALSSMDNSNIMLSYTLPVIGYILNLTPAETDYLTPLIDLILKCTLR
ncbi:unnamed protein product, partial [Didymodactylos carnosus]